MGRLWHREALPLLPYQLNMPRTWGGNSSCISLVRSFSVSNATSQFSGKGKRSAWKAWKTYPAATTGFTSASQGGFVPLEFTFAAFRLIEQFTCIMYESTTSYDRANDLRQEARIWSNSLKPITAAANPEGFGWTWEDTGWRPFWRILPATNVGCRELWLLTHLYCAKKCRCKTAGLTRTALCLCRGLCESHEQAHCSGM